MVAIVMVGCSIIMTEGLENQGVSPWCLSIRIDMDYEKNIYKGFSLNIFNIVYNNHEFRKWRHFELENVLHK